MTRELLVRVNLIYFDAILILNFVYVIFVFDVIDDPIERIGTRV